MPDHHPAYQRHAARDRDVRASDRDRDAVADALRDGHVAGRLTSDEFQERLDYCLQATTYGDLDRLVADLPARGRAAPRRWPPRPSPELLVPLVLALIVFSHGRALWLVVPVFFLLIRPQLAASRPARSGRR